MKEIAAATLCGSAADCDIADQRVFRTGNPGRGVSYAEVAARAIELGGASSGQIWPAGIHLITQRAVWNLAGTSLIGIAKGTAPQVVVFLGLAVAFVEIELDLETGTYDILHSRNADRPTKCTNDRALARIETNTSIQLRALLTYLFLASEAARPREPE